MELFMQKFLMSGYEEVVIYEEGNTFELVLSDTLRMSYRNLEELDFFVDSLVREFEKAKRSKGR